MHSHLWLLFCVFLAEQPGGTEGADFGVPAKSGKQPREAADPARETAGQPGTDGGVHPQQLGSAGSGESTYRQWAAASGTHDPGHHKEDG